jgi:FKBP-type peptidyl-prolyl cis-trans isomerase
LSKNNVFFSYLRYEKEGVEDGVVYMLQDGMTVKGFLKGLPGMCIGEIRRLTVPPHLAFGSRGTGMTIFIRNMVGFI